MKRAWIVAAAAAIDAIVGDPPGVPHPVRAIGWAIRRGEGVAREVFGATPPAERVAGTALSLAVIAASAFAGATARSGGAIVETLAAGSTLALRCLLEEAGAVLESLERADIVKARKRLARIVGRDTAGLDETSIARAVIETLAESACDGVIAPLFYLALGGVPCALAYKAINTLDSTIGHIEPPYRHFGWFAARTDDAANYAPARITAALIAAAAELLEARGATALATWRSDGARHLSPNAGQSEAAMAGALGVRLGGDNTYHGVQTAGAVLGEAFRAARTCDIRRAMRVVCAASLLAYGIAIALTAILDA